KVSKSGGMPEVVANNLTLNTGGRYDVMNTTNALPDKMKALAERLALDHRRMEAWYELDFQTDSADFKPIDVGVARSGARLEVSERRKTQPSPRDLPAFVFRRRLYSAAWLNPRSRTRRCRRSSTSLTSRTGASPTSFPATRRIASRCTSSTAARTCS